MFTVKHRESDHLGASEYLHSAEKIEIIRRGDHFADGIYLGPEPAPGPVPSEAVPPQQPPPSFAKHIILFGGDQTTDALARQGGKVWIMNEAGNTVAAYEL